jgi:hypothetical protein
MPVGTRATVKNGLTQRDLADDLGVQILLCDTYRLFLRLGHELIREMGGLHRSMSWPNVSLPTRADSKSSWCSTSVSSIPSAASKHLQLVVVAISTILIGEGLRPRREVRAWTGSGLTPRPPQTCGTTPSRRIHFRPLPELNKLIPGHESSRTNRAADNRPG